MVVREAFLEINQVRLVRNAFYIMVILSSKSPDIDAIVFMDCFASRGPDAEGIGRVLLLRAMVHQLGVC